ncbi:hypothetical protein Tco_1417416 [Tanacetum coccineum]
MILPPVFVEEQIVVQRETKARTILLQSLPEDHMADFHHLYDARDNWLAVKARFGDGVKYLRALSPWGEGCRDGGVWRMHWAVKAKGCGSRCSSYDSKKKSNAINLRVLVTLLGNVQKNSWILKQDHEGEDVENGAAQVYGMIARAEEDAAGSATGNATGDVADEFLMRLKCPHGYLFTEEPLYDRFLSKLLKCMLIPLLNRNFPCPPSNNPDLDDTHLPSQSRSLCKRKSFGSKTCFVCGSKFHLIKDCDFYEKQLELHKKPMWNNVANIPSFVPKAAFVPAGSRNRPTYVPAVSRNRPTSVPTSRPFFIGWKNNAARPMTRLTSHYFQQISRPGYYNHMNMDKGRWETAVKPLAGVPLENSKAKYAMGSKNNGGSTSSNMVLTLKIIHKAKASSQ